MKFLHGGKEGGETLVLLGLFVESCKELKISEECPKLDKDREAKKQNLRALEKRIMIVFQIIIKFIINYFNYL